jgi:hypothetical protein
MHKGSSMMLAVVQSPFPWRFFVKRASIFVIAAFALTALAAKAADSSKVTGWISDSMCGAKHAGSGAECVKKCIEGGMKPVLVDQSKNVWSIDNPEAVKNFYGDKVTVTATTDNTAKSVHIEAVKAAK